MAILVTGELLSRLSDALRQALVHTIRSLAVCSLPCEHLCRASQSAGDAAGCVGRPGIRQRSRSRSGFLDCAGISDQADRHRACRLPHLEGQMEDGSHVCPYCRRAARADDSLFGWGSVQSGVPLSIAGIHIGAYPPLQNLWGTAQRWFTAHEYGWSVANNPAFSDQAGLLLSLGLAIATIVFCRPPFHRNSWRDADLGMVIIAVALIVPATWYHHYAILAIPLAILIASARNPDGHHACSRCVAGNRPIRRSLA